MKNRKTILIASSVILLASFFIGANVYKNYESERLNFLSQENSELFIRDYSPQQGHKDAKVFITEFLDPECESCRAFYPQVKKLLKKYDGKVKIIVRYAAFHRNSKIVIAALEASRNQNKYWESLEILFQNQPIWGNHQNPQPHLIYDYLSDIGIDIAKLKKDMKDERIQKIIAQDASDLKELKVRGTPTFFVNGTSPENFGIQYLKKAIELEIQKHY